MAGAKSWTAAAPMRREPPVMSAALPAREIMNPPKTRKYTNLRLVSDDLTGACGSDELLEQALRKRIVRHALWMPLDSYNPVGIAGPLDRLINAVGGLCCDAGFFPGLVDRLMMTAVDVSRERPCKLREQTSGS